MKKLFISAILTLFCHLTLQAVPAYPVKKMIMTVDGSLVQATLRGDEFIHYYETEQGECFQPLASGLYARITDGEMTLLREQARVRQQQANQRRIPARNRNRAVTLGKKKGLVILVYYTDQTFSVDDPQATFNDFFNQKGYDKHGMSGSVADYFRAQSYGQFELEFDVVGPYKLSQNMAYYGQPKDGQHDSRVRDMISEAVIKANNDVNYQDYDWDNDGTVDQVFVIYAGYGENYGADPNTIWPHESRISLDMKFDGKNIRTYACSCELKGTSGTRLDGIGTPCHEFSHCLGIMDHYDTQGNNFGMGNWDIMCSGSYNNGACTPAAYTSYERWVSGWLEPVEVNSLTEVKGMKALVDAPEVYVLYNEGNRNEYYLLENRQQKGFDSELSGHGLLVVHVDYDEGSWGGNVINAGDRQRMTIVAADGEYGSYYSSSLAGDPFPGIGRVSALTDYSSPAAILNNKNSDKSFLMHKPVECITEDEQGLISMLLCADPLAVPTGLAATDFTPNSFRITWDPVPGAAGYELYLDETGKRASVEDALILSEDFSGCYSKSVGFTDISKNLSGYLRGFSGNKLFTTPDLLRIGTGTATGYLCSPVFPALNTGDLTIVMKVKPYKNGTAVNGEVKISTNTPATTQSFKLNFNQETTLVFHSDIKFFEVFRFDIEPSSAMYIQGLSLYDGNFTDKELGLDSPSKAPHRIQVGSYNSTSNSYEFTDLKPSCNYAVKIRAWDDRNRVSDWTELYQVENPTAIQTATARQNSGLYFDLQGRRTAAPTHGLYIHGGKKVMVK